MSNPKRAQRKPERIVSTQSPGVPLNRGDEHPADVLMNQAFAAQVEPNSAQPGTTQHNLLQVEPSSNKSIQPVSPARDFTKYANSLLRQTPALFKGLSKQTYDALYKKTRGAINPVRLAQLTKSEVCRLAGLHENTVLQHLKHLKAVGLIRVEYKTGKHEGSIYEVFLPEEIGQTEPATSHHKSPQPNPPQDATTQANTLQNLLPRPPQNLSPLVAGNLVENKGGSGDAKTSFKTIDKNDDEPLRAPFKKFAEILNQKLVESCGKGISEKDSDALIELAEILGDEFAAARLKTKSISAPAAFLVAHLKSRLATPLRFEKQQTRVDAVGKSDAAKISFALENIPLDERADYAAEFCTTCGKLHDECGCGK